METIPRNFLTVDALNTVSGAAFAVFAIVTVTKSLIKRYAADYWIRPYVLMVSWCVLLYARSLSSRPELAGWGLIFINGFVVALAAMGLHETITDPGAQKVRITRFRPK